MSRIAIRHAARAISPGLLLLTLGCFDTTPAKIDFSAPPSVIVNRKLLPLHASVVNKKGVALSGRTVSFAATPADVLEVSSTGVLRCLKSGDASLTLSSAPISSGVEVKCRVPIEIRMPAELRLVLGSAPTALHAQAVGEGGQAMPDAPVQITSSDPSIVAVQGDTAKPVAVGRARLQAAVDEITAVTPVEVVETIVSEPLVLPDGARRSVTLKRGDYLVAVDVKADFHANQGVTVTWEGAACENQPEQQSHHVRCRVEETATVTITNPKQLGLGARMAGTLSIFRVPAGI